MRTPRANSPFERGSPLSSPTATLSTPTPTPVTTPAEEPVERWRVLVSRNPVVKLRDLSGGEPARKWKEHKRTADGLAAELASGDLFTLVQPAGHGFWASEWTVVGHGEHKSAARRRAGRGATVQEAVEAMMEHPSFHQSHFWRPEETFWSTVRRWL